MGPLIHSFSPTELLGSHITSDQSSYHAPDTEHQNRSAVFDVTITTSGSQAVTCHSGVPGYHESVGSPLIGLICYDVSTRIAYNEAFSKVPRTLLLQFGNPRKWKNAQRINSMHGRRSLKYYALVASRTLTTHYSL